MKYPKLFSPLKIGSLTVKNRIFTAPTGCSDLTPEGYLTPQNIAMYRQKAKAGAAVVSLGEALISQDRGKAHGRMIPLDDVECLPSLIDCTDAVKQYGAYTSIELIHAGCRARPEYCRRGPVGPSAHMGVYGEMVEELTEEGIEEIVEQFGQAAFMAKCGGIDIICIHACHGWILSQFMAPATNQRTDRFGGNIENRTRFARMVIQRVRKYCGNTPIEFRLSGSDLYEGGCTIEDAVEYCRILDGMVDLFHISAGSFHVPDTSTRMFASMYLPTGVNVPFAQQIKQAVITPVATVGGLGCEPAGMEEILTSGKADIINVARAVMADTNLVNKIKEGRQDEISTCLRCNMCLSLSFVPHVPFAVRVLRCSVNPIIGREMETQLMPTKAERPKRVLIAGGGPGGMQAAITASGRGHEVILCEKTGRLGGMLVSADDIGFKHNMTRYKNALITQVNKAPVKILLNTEVTAALVEEIAPDVLIAAVGARAVVPCILGIDGDNVYLAARDFGQDKPIGQKVVIVGGGLVGCEEGIHYAHEGKDVTLLEMGDTLAPDAWFLHLRATMMEMEQAGVKSHLHTRCTKITHKGVYAVDTDGKEQFFEADSVVIAAGLRPLSDTVEELRPTAPDFWAIGDCCQPKTITEAVRMGYDAAISI